MCGRRRERTHHEVLEETCSSFNLVVRSRSQETSLLQEDSVGSIHLAHIYRYALPHAMYQCHVGEREEVGSVRIFERRRYNS